MRLASVSLAMLAMLASADEAPPDTSRIFRLVGRFGMGHGCPVAPDTALTSAHVVDVRPFDPSVRLLPYPYSDGTGEYRGVLIPRYAHADRDIAVMRGSFVHHYHRATRAPLVGERVWFVGYRFDGKRALETRVIKAVVQRVLAGHVVYHPGGAAGSSGSCVLNDAGEAVAINSYTVNGDNPAGIGVGVWQGVLNVKPEDKE